MITDVGLTFHFTTVNYLSVNRMEKTTVVILPAIVEKQLKTADVIIALITEARLLDLIQD